MSSFDNTAAVTKHKVESTALQFVGAAFTELGGSAMYASERGKTATYMRVTSKTGKTALIGASAEALYTNSNTTHQDVTIYLTSNGEERDGPVEMANYYDRSALAASAVRLARAVMKEMDKETIQKSQEIINQANSDGNLNMRVNFKNSLGGDAAYEVTVTPIQNGAQASVRKVKGNNRFLVGIETVNLIGSSDPEEDIRYTIARAVQNVGRKRALPTEDIDALEKIYNRALRK